ncbi:MAG: DUF4190 domain-containing protein [Candidatus Woesearchaeota archaeon]
MKQTQNSSTKSATNKTNMRDIHKANSKNAYVKKELKVIEKKDNVYSMTSFICGLLFWVPLFNFILGPMAIIFGIMGLKYARLDPDRYGGEVLAIIGIILGSFAVIFTLIGLYVSIFHPELLGFNSTIFKR